MTVEASSTLQSLQKKKPQTCLWAHTWGWGHCFMPHLPHRSSQRQDGWEVSWQLLGMTFSPWFASRIWCWCSSVCAAELCWHCRKTHQSGGAAAEFEVWVSGIGGRGGMESCWYFQATNEIWRRIKLLCLSHTRQHHWSTQPLPPAPQPSISHGSCLLLPLVGEVLFPPPFFPFFLYGDIFIWAYFPIWSHPKVAVDGWFFSSFPVITHE